MSGKEVLRNTRQLVIVAIISLVMLGLLYGIYEVSEMLVHVALEATLLVGWVRIVTAILAAVLYLLGLYITMTMILVGIYVIVQPYPRAHRRFRQLISRRPLRIFRGARLLIYSLG